MSYAEKFLKSKGQDCIIDRDVPVNTKVSIKRSTRASRDLGVREGYWEGLILYDANIQSGEIISIRDNKYLVQTVDYDPASMECAFFAAKCNAVLKHQRYVEDVDENNNLIQEWKTLNEFVYAFENIETYRLSSSPIGLVDSTKYVFEISKSEDIKELDRLVYEGKNYKPVSINNSMKGILIIQAAFDERP